MSHMIHVNTWRRGEVIAAYTATDDEVPRGVPFGRQGNAVLIMDGDILHVVSRPIVEGSILDVVPDAAGAPEMNISNYCTRSENARCVIFTMRNFI